MAASRRGLLVLVVGPSGAGKDTLMAYCRERLAHDQGFVFPRRVVTRQGSAHEDNATMTRDVFLQAAASGHFALAWQAHGFCYGVPSSILDDLAAGRCVVVNVSRTVVVEARRRLNPLLVAAITAPPEALADRLAARGRETTAEVVDRASRTVAPIHGADVVEVDNSGSVEEGGEALLAAIVSGRADGVA